MRSIRFLLALLAAAMTLPVASCASAKADAPWVPDLGDGTYKNPIIYADYSDPDVCRAGDDYYMTASSFANIPGLPILHSRDLVNWTLIGHAAPRLSSRFDSPQHGNGIWAPSIRYHGGKFWIFVGDPDFGILMTTAENPAGPWAPLHVVQEGKGLIDTCPLWDDDGKAYLVHAYANSRAGRNSILVVNEMAPDGSKLIGDEVMVYDGRNGVAPTIEGPKFYRRDGWYWILAPAGGVTGGWEQAMRSKTPMGQYEAKRVLEQGSTRINGPHQGGLVDTPDGVESWFIHFQDKGAYGRIVHLNPVDWSSGWPQMGIDLDGNGIGEPVETHAKPKTGAAQPIAVPQTSDDFDAPAVGLQWQWEANPREDWFSLAARPGWMRLNAAALPQGGRSLRDTGAVLGQKFPAPVFTVTTKMELSKDLTKADAGLVILGQSYAALEAARTPGGRLRLSQTIFGPGGVPGAGADGQGAGSAGAPDERTVAETSIPDGPVWLRVAVAGQAQCDFSYSIDGKTFTAFGKPFAAAVGRWIGARVGLFCSAPDGTPPQGHADFDFMRIE